MWRSNQDDLLLQKDLVKRRIEYLEKTGSYCGCRFGLVEDMEGAVVWWRIWKVP